MWLEKWSTWASFKWEQMHGAHLPPGKKGESCGATTFFFWCTTPPINLCQLSCIFWKYFQGTPKSQACLLQRDIRYKDLIELVLEMKIPFFHHRLPGQGSAYQEHFIPGINFHQSFNTSCFRQKQTDDGTWRAVAAVFQDSLKEGWCLELDLAWARLLHGEAKSSVTSHIQSIWEVGPLCMDLPIPSCQPLCPHHF